MHHSTSRIIRQTLQVRLGPIYSKPLIGTRAACSAHQQKCDDKHLPSSRPYRYRQLCLQSSFTSRGGHILPVSSVPTQHTRNFSSIASYFSQKFTVSAAAEDLSSTTTAASFPPPSTPSPPLDASTPPSTPEVVVAPLNSSTPLSPTGDAIEYIPLPPTPFPDGIDPSILTALGEPSLASLGQGGWGPVGIMQSILEWIHVTADVPWWAAIAIGTVCLRTLLFPVVVIAQRNAAMLSNASPQMQALQLKVTEARQIGDQLHVAKYSAELMDFMKTRKINPIKSMLVPLAQAPIFISMFVGLRRCANLPVLSFTTGGALWFTDLTLADPYYILPVLTSLTMYLTIELGTEVGRLQGAENARIMFTILRFMPLVTFPFMCNFPAAVLCYWMTTNMMSLGQAGLLRIPKVRTALNIPLMVKHAPSSLPMTQQQSKKSTFQAAKDSWNNMKITREIADRHRFDEVRFAKAGTGPVVRTFKFDPTKARANKSGVGPNVINVKAKIK